MSADELADSLLSLFSDGSNEPPDTLPDAHESEEGSAPQADNVSGARDRDGSEQETDAAWVKGRSIGAAESAAVELIEAWSVAPSVVPREKGPETEPVVSELEPGDDPAAGESAHEPVGPAAPQWAPQRATTWPAAREAIAGAGPVSGEVGAQTTGAALAQDRERILRFLLTGATAAGSIGVVAMIVGSVQDPRRLPAFAPFFLAYVVIVLAHALRRVPAVWRAGVLIGVSYSVSVSSILQNGVTGTGPWYLLAIPTLFFVLIGERAGLVASIVNALAYLVLALAFHLGWIRELAPIVVGESLSQFLVVAATFVLITAVVSVVYSLFARSQRRAQRSLQVQSETLAAAQVEDARQRRELERANATLRRQAQHFGLSVEVGRLAAMGLSLADFAQRAASLVYERAEADYVGLFLLDEERVYAHLHATAGISPGQPEAPRRRVRVIDDLLLRQCVSSGREQVVLGIDHVQSLTNGEESLFLRPDTHAALALPLVSQGTVFGVLTVQSRSPVAFGRDDIVSLRTVADQVATALTSARLTEELRSRLAELETLQRYYVREAWDEFLTTYGPEEHGYALSALLASDGARSGNGSEGAAIGLSPAADGFDGAPGALVAPISLRDQVLGVLEFQHADADEAWSDDQVALIEAVSEQMSMILENSRLFADARLRAARERRIGEISARLRESLDVEHVLQTAVREIGEALDLHDITIQLESPTRQAIEGDSST